MKGGACASGEPSGEQTTWNEMPQDEENPESQTQIAEMPEVTVMCQLDARFRASGRQQVCNCAFCQESVNVGCVWVRLHDRHSLRDAGDGAVDFDDRMPITKPSPKVVRTLSGNYAGEPATWLYASRRRE